MSVMQKLFNKRTLILALVAGSGALVASSYAMPGGGTGPAGCAARQGGQPQVSQDRNVQTQREAFRAKRLAALKDKLGLKPEQEAAWRTFASAAQPRPMGMDRQALGAELKTLNTPQRLDKMLSLADERRARMIERAETVKRFYAQLSPEQQSVFDAEARLSRSGEHRHHRHHDRGRNS